MSPSNEDLRDHYYDEDLEPVVMTAWEERIEDEEARVEVMYRALLAREALP